MAEIEPIYIVKYDNEIINTATYFSDAQSIIIDNICENTNDVGKRCAIDNEYDGIEIVGQWCPASDIAESCLWGGVDSVFRDMIESSVEDMYDVDVGECSVCDYDDSHAISCGLIIDGKHIIDDERFMYLGGNPQMFTATDGTEWNIAKIDDDYVIVPEKNHAIFIVRNQSNGIPMVGDGEYFGFDKEKFNARLLELHSVGAMILNLFENDEIVIVTFYL